MRKLHIILCVSFLGRFLSAQVVIEEPDAALSPNIPGFFENILHFPFHLFPDDTFFSSWRIPVPDFHQINEGPAFSEIPAVEVHCDKSQLTLFVEKRFDGDILDGTQIQLGDGCYSNGETPNHFIFTYGSDECGTTHEVLNDLDVLSNTVYIKLQNPPFTWWNPSAVHISCATKRSDDHLSFLVSDALPLNGRTFNIKLMNPSWTSTAESTIFKRGQVVHLQVSADTRRDEQLFVQSCFISASPEPHARPQHAVVLNKGCAAPLGSSHMMAQFVDSDRQDVVNLAVTTSFITSEFYIHCSVLVSNQSNTSGSKSCNYNFTQFRWEDLSGNADVCKCCSSKCKSLSLKHLPRDAKATVSTGPLLIEDEDDMVSSVPVADSLQSSPVETVDKIISGASFTNRFSDSSQFSSPESVVNQGRVLRLTLWLPGETQDTEPHRTDSEPEDDSTAELEQSDMEWDPTVELPPLSTDQQISLNAPANEITRGNQQGGALPWDVNALMLLDGRPIPPHLEEAAIEEESQRKKRLETVGAVPPPGEISIDDLEKLAQEQTEVYEERNDVQPVIRRKIQFSRGVDGSRALSYEEEMRQEEEGMGEGRHLGVHGFKTEGLLSSFLDLLRRMDRAE